MYKIRQFSNGPHIEVAKGVYRPFRNCAGWRWDYRA